MSKNQEKEFFLHFDHPLQCMTGDCERLTSWGHAMYWDGGREIMLLPLCWEHGFALRDFVPTGKQQIAKYIKEQNASVERFVVGYHGGKGTARVIASCDPQDVPRFTLSRLEEHETLVLDENWPMPDYAWYVCYEYKGIRRYGYTTFVCPDWRFEWYEADAGDHMFSGDKYFRFDGQN
jgi:hypothetical protein